ncbi:MAG: hypothetical protein HY834_08445 [Devosia nanyangense]|uniref:DUF2007 domain-containing protein n=1 Tax=Devosia nanyangense TaxID=1228055 RepID=A0A933L2C1_9HYPH|nr:hypothetical protein [Devosia nanyangense]MDO8361215.1 hypothetical protein [Devosia sp.]
MYETIAHVPDPSLARVLIAALQAHGFHPMEGGEGGLPGVTDPFFGKGIPIRVPDDEAADCRVLAEDLLKQMLKR